MKPISDITGSWITITAQSPMQRHQIAADRGDQQIDDAADRGGAGGQPGDEFGGMPVGEEADVFVEQLVEQTALIVGDDAVADPRQRDGGAVGGKSLGGEDAPWR